MRKINKLMLIYPNQRWLKTDITTTWNQTPYAICLLAAMIRDMVSVKIIDAQFYNLSREAFKNEIRDFKPDMVGVSLLSSEYGEIGNMSVSDIKEVDKTIITVVGGVHVTTMYKKVMENSLIDYAVHGEGEYILPGLINYLNGKGQYPQTGLIRRRTDGSLEVLPRSIVEDLNSLPMPAYDLIDYKKYAMTIQRYGVDAPSRLPFARFPTSRGCPMGCSFCQVDAICGKKIRFRSEENVVKELSYLINQYGIRAYHFEDDNAFFFKDRTKKLLKMMIDKELNLSWKATGVFLPSLDEEICHLMAKSGCEMLNIAVESGSIRVLKEIIGKPIDLIDVPKKIAMAQKEGIYIAANFILGLPGESWEEILKTVSYAESCGADYVKFFMATPLFGTRMYDLAKELKCIVGDETKVDQRYSVLKGVDWEPKDVSILRVYEWDRINFSDPQKRSRTARIMNISLEELDNIRQSTRNTLNFK